MWKNLQKTTKTLKCTFNSIPSNINQVLESQVLPSKSSWVSPLGGVGAGTVVGVIPNAGLAAPLEEVAPSPHLLLLLGGRLEAAGQTGYFVRTYTHPVGCQATAVLPLVKRGKDGSVSEDRRDATETRQTKVGQAGAPEFHNHKEIIR